MKLVRRIIPVLLVMILALGCFITAANASGTVNMITTGQAHMRKEPNKDSKKLATLPKGAILKCADFKTDSRGVKWYFTCYETKKGWVDGWVSAKNLKSYNGKPTSKPTAKPTGKPHSIDKTKLITTGSCHLRKNADVDAKILDTLPKGTIISSEKYSKDSRGVKWYYTKYDGQKGWVSERNLKHYHTEDPTPKPTPKPIDYDAFEDVGCYMKVTATNLKMRMAPSTDYSVVETLYAGDIVYAVRGNGSWYEVEDSANGRHGYMSAKYLEEVHTPKTVYPQDMTMDVNDLTDGILSVSFESHNVEMQSDGVVVMKDVTVYTKDIYDIVDINTLSVGDVIVIDGQEIVVDTLENDDRGVIINGGNESSSGYELRPVDEDNCYVVNGLDDAPTFTEQGTRDFVVNEDAVYTDDADPSNHVEANYQFISAMINKSEYSYTPYNTTIELADGAVVKITRVYTP